LNFFAVLRLSAGKDLRAHAAYLNVVGAAGPLRNLVTHGSALTEVSVDRYLSRADARFQREEISEGASVEHPRGPGRPIDHQRFNFSEIGARSISCGFNEDLVVIRSFNYRKIRKRIPTKLLVETCECSCITGIEVGGHFVSLKVAAVIDPGSVAL
jgi:hypothetical protein